MVEDFPPVGSPFYCSWCGRACRCRQVVFAAFAALSRQDRREIVCRRRFENAARRYEALRESLALAVVDSPREYRLSDQRVAPTTPWTTHRQRCPRLTEPVPEHPRRAM